MSAPQPQPQPNGATAAPHLHAEVLHLVDFKWLMAGEGHRIDLARLQSDRAYARGCLALADSSTCATLRTAADRLRRSLPVLAEQG